MSHERPGDEDLTHRERKKIQTKRRIHETALDLALEYSYAEVSVETIAERSHVSPSTVYRYFSTKEGVFLWDEYDSAFMAAFESLLAEHDPVEAMTRAVHTALASRFELDQDRALSQSLLIESVEPLKQSMAARLDEMRTAIATMVSENGWQPLEANVFAGAMVGAFNAALEVWTATGGRESLPPLFDRAIRLLGDGLDSVE